MVSPHADSCGCEKCDPEMCANPDHPLTKWTNVQTRPTIVECERYVRRMERGGGAGQLLVSVQSDHMVAREQAKRNKAGSVTTPVEAGAAETAGNPRCVAHGKPACDLCSIGARECTSCMTGPGTGMHWDTCQNRVRVRASGTEPQTVSLPSVFTAEPAPDPVNHPAHYTAHPSGVECITITRHMNFNLGNALKYIWRAGLKGDSAQDLEKAIWYITDELARLRGEPGHDGNDRGGSTTEVAGSADGVQRCAKHGELAGGGRTCIACDGGVF